jgi:hypothetical protein
MTEQFEQVPGLYVPPRHGKRSLREILSKAADPAAIVWMQDATLLLTAVCQRLARCGIGLCRSIAVNLFLHYEPQAE